MSTRSRLLMALTALSGFAGLGYEMVWVRLLGVALGTEIAGVLGAVVGLFAGLALGAVVLDGPLRRARSPWRAYALLETVIGGWGLVTVWLLPAVGRLLPPLLGPTPVPWVQGLVSFLVPVIVLLPATVAMGGTLTVLERMLAATLGQPRVVAGVYAANTAGAVLGTLAAAFVLFAALGLSGTLGVLALANAVCAIGALRLDPKDMPAAPVVSAARSLGGVGLALFATGLLGIGVELVIVRLAAQVLENTIYTFAGLLAAYLIGSALGSALRPRLPGVGTPAARAVLCAITASAVLVPVLLVPDLEALATRVAPLGTFGELLVALALFLGPSIAMGALCADLLQAARDARGSLGVAYGLNALGAALAPPVATLVLLPVFGAVGALLVASLGYLVLLPWRRTSLVALGPLLVIGYCAVTPPSPLVHVPPGGRLVAMREGPSATASVVDDASGARYLEINGHFRMGGTSSMRSDYRQALLPLLLHGAPHRALYLGVGTGATLAGATHYPGLAVTGIEISPEAVDLLGYFAPASDAAVGHVTLADARRFVAADRSSYDVIVADNYHPALEGSGALYTVEHFRAIRARLAPDGLFCQWLPLYQLDPTSLKTIIRTFLEVYPGGSAWLAHLSVRMPMLALVGPRDAPRAGGRARLSGALPPIPELTAIGFASPSDVAAAYLGSAATLRSYAGDGGLNTDDRPRVALAARDNVGALNASPVPLLLSLLHTLSPAASDLVGADAGTAALERLDRTLRARTRFVEVGAALEGEPRGRALIDAAAPGLLEVVRIAGDFEPAYQPLLEMAAALAESDVPAARALLAEMVAAAPNRPEAAAQRARLR
jgi:spermidine synthase